MNRIQRLSELRKISSDYDDSYSEWFNQPGMERSNTFEELRVKLSDGNTYMMDLYVEWNAYGEIEKAFVPSNSKVFMLRGEDFEEIESFSNEIIQEYKKEAIVQNEKVVYDYINRHTPEGSDDGSTGLTPAQRNPSLK